MSFLRLYSGGVWGQNLTKKFQEAINKSTRTDEAVKAYLTDSLDTAELRDARGRVDDHNGTLWLTIKNQRNEYHLPLKYNQFWEVLDVFPLIPDKDEHELLQSTLGSN